MDLVQDEGLGPFIVKIDVLVHGVDQFHNISKHAAPQAVGGEVSRKEAFDHIQPRGTGGAPEHDAIGPLMFASDPEMYYLSFSS